MDISSFKAIMYEIALAVNGRMISIHTPSITRNFFAAELSFNGTTLFVLCSTNELWAFSEKMNPSECELAFVDSQILSAALSNLFGFTPLSTDELNSPFKKRADVSDADIKYWKPKSLGDAVFNWWD